MSAFYYWVIAVLISLVILMDMARALRLSLMRSKGLFPKKGAETIDDVANMLKSGQRYDAIYCYRLIHKKVSLKQAVEQVNKLVQTLLA